MEVCRFKAGEAVLTMTVKPNMVNGQGIAMRLHFPADSAFAFFLLCNSYNERAVTAIATSPLYPPGSSAIG